MAIVQADFGVSDPLLTKRQLAQHPEIRRSTRWVEMRVAEGMPSHLDGNRRMFRLSAVRTWIAENLPNVRLSAEPTLPPSPRQGKRRTSAPRRPAERTRPTDSTPAPARKGGDRSRAQAVAALEAAIKGLQRQLDELRGPPPAA